MSLFRALKLLFFVISIFVAVELVKSPLYLSVEAKQEKCERSECRNENYQNQSNSQDNREKKENTLENKEDKYDKHENGNSEKGNDNPQENSNVENSNDKNNNSSDNKENTSESNNSSSLSENIQTQDHKILICHVPPGNPENAHVIDVDKSAWENGHTPHNSHNMDYVVSSSSQCPRKPTSTPFSAITPTLTATPTPISVSIVTPTPTQSVSATPTPTQTSSSKSILALSTFAPTGKAYERLWTIIQFIGLIICTAALYAISKLRGKRMDANLKEAVILFLFGSSVFMMGTFGKYTYNTVVNAEQISNNSPVSYSEKISIPSLQIDSRVIRGGMIDGKWMLSDNYILYINEKDKLDNGSNTVFYGHNTGNLLKNLKNISIGENIYITGNKGNIYKYKVYSVQKVGFNSKMGLKQDNNSLIIYTCDGWLDQYRIIVKAKNVS